MFHVKRLGPDPLAHLAEHLAQLDRDGLRRRAAAPLPADAISFCSNDYLGLAARPAPSAPSGAGASRLIAGERDQHQQLEGALARWLGSEQALLFTSGYAANVGTLAALAGPGDLIVSDALNHASLIDGARLSRARIAVVPHADLAAVRAALTERTEARAWVAVESYYSMDADSPDLGALREVCDEHGAGLIVDEAHALGVLGPQGRGLCAAAGVVPDVLVGTLGKAFGGQGAFVAGRAVLRDFLWNRARSFVFSTGLAPVNAAAAMVALDQIVAHPELAVHVAAMATRLRTGLERAGASRLLGFGHVVPLLVGGAPKAVHLAERMRSHGISVNAIRPPTVPPGTSRIRLTVTARHAAADIDRVIEAYASAFQVTVDEEAEAEAQ